MHAKTLIKSQLTDFPLLLHYLHTHNQLCTFIFCPRIGSCMVYSSRKTSWEFPGVLPVAVAVFKVELLGS